MDNFVKNMRFWVFLKQLVFIIISDSSHCLSKKSNEFNALQWIDKVTCAVGKLETCSRPAVDYLRPRQAISRMKTP